MPDALNLSAGATLGVSFNNYLGPALDLGIKGGASFKIAEKTSKNQSFFLQCNLNFEQWYINLRRIKNSYSIDIVHKKNFKSCTRISSRNSSCSTSFLFLSKKWQELIVNSCKSCWESSSFYNLLATSEWKVSEI